MNHWTTNLPTQSGFYWYRYYPQATPEIVEWDQDLEWMKCIGDDRAFVSGTITGEFWPEKLQAPTQRAGVPALP